MTGVSVAGEFRVAVDVDGVKVEVEVNSPCFPKLLVPKSEALNPQTLSRKDLKSETKTSATHVPKMPK